jgi:hypothetical protein
MKNQLPINKKSYLQLLVLVPAIGLLGLTACSSIDGTAGKSQTGNYLTIGASTYNSESHGFERPWPFGPESSQQ